MPSFTKLAIVTANTERSGGITDGLETSYVVSISGLSCLPLDPVTPELTLGIEGLGWRETLQTMTQGDLDIVEGDLLVVGSGEYPIRSVSNWTWKGSEYKHLLVEEKK